MPIDNTLPATLERHLLENSELVQETHYTQTLHRKTFASLHKFLLASEADSKQKRVYASSHPECWRKQAYSLLKVPPTDAEFVYDWWLKARLGDAIHAHIALKELWQFNPESVLEYGGLGLPAIELHYLDFYKQAKGIYPDSVLPELSALIDEMEARRIGLRGDIILQTPSGEQIPGEFKTVDNVVLYDDTRLKTRQYWEQCQLEIHFWRDTKTGKIPQRGWLCVVSRQNLADRREFFVKYEPDYVKLALARIDELWRYVDAKELPPPEPERGPCKLCKWRRICPAWKDKGNPAPEQVLGLNAS